MVDRDPRKQVIGSVVEGEEGGIAEEEEVQEEGS